MDSSEAVGSDGLGDKWTLDELEREPGMDRTREEPEELDAWTGEVGDICWVAMGKRSREGVGRLAGGDMWQCWVRSQRRIGRGGRGRRAVGSCQESGDCQAA